MKNGGFNRDIFAINLEGGRVEHIMARIVHQRRRGDPQNLDVRAFCDKTRY